MTVAGRVLVAFWLLALGYLGFYVFGLVMGLFSPIEMLGFTIAAAVIAVSFTVHAIRVSHAIRDHADDEMMRGIHQYRERRGF
jgi:hypothetical protein